MVIQFLKKMRSQLLEEKLDFESEYQSIQIKLSENQIYLERLKEEDAQNFDVFSPRKQNTVLRDSVNMLENEQNLILEESHRIKKKLAELDAKLDELDSVTKIAVKQYAANQKTMNDSLKDNDVMKLKILETQEYERQRIARDLHDSSVQSLTSLVHKTELCSKLVDIDSIRCKLELTSVSKTIRDIIEEMRMMIYDLHPMSFDDIGFEVTLERDLSKLQKYGVSASFTVDGQPYPLKPVIALTLLRVIKEACNNVLKHAEASMIAVNICYDSECLRVIVEDDGKGFNVAEQNEINGDYSGFGLSTMKERICLLSGNIDIQSEIGEGTKIIIEIPVK